LLLLFVGNVNLEKQTWTMTFRRKLEKYL